MLRVLIIFLFFSLMNLGGSRAEPNQHSQFLMTTPVSLFDMGMFRLEQFIKEDIKTTQEIYEKVWRKSTPMIHYEPTIVYDWNSDKIIITTYLKPSVLIDRAIKRQQCFDWIDYVQQRAGFYNGVNQKLENDILDIISSFFNHQSFTSVASKEAAGDIADKIYLECIIPFTADAQTLEDHKDKLIVTVHSTLKSNVAASIREGNFSD